MFETSTPVIGAKFHDRTTELAVLERAITKDEPGR